MKLYEESVRITPIYSNGHFGIAGILTKLGLLDQAIDEYLLALKYRPEFPDALNNLGFIYLSQNKFKEARIHLEGALKLRPDYPKALDNLRALTEAEKGHPLPKGGDPLFVSPGPP